MVQMVDVAAATPTSSSSHHHVVNHPSNSIGRSTEEDEFHDNHHKRQLSSSLQQELNDSKEEYNDDDDDDDDDNHEDNGSSVASIDTQDAFLEMLGLKNTTSIDQLDINNDNVDDGVVPLTSILVMDDDDEELLVDNETTIRKNMNIQPLQLPLKCSRYYGSSGSSGSIPSSNNNNNNNNCTSSSSSSFIAADTATATAIMISNFCTQDECNELIQLATNYSSFQYIKEASHIDSNGNHYKVQIQNPNPHKLAVFEHSITSTKLWKRLQPLLVLSIQQQQQEEEEEKEEEDELKQQFHKHQHQQERTIQSLFNGRQYGGPPIGLNPRLRILQYDASDKDEFKPHFDARTNVTIGSTNNKKIFTSSRITVLLYLNNGNGIDFEGGETLYLQQSDISSSTTSASPTSSASTLPAHHHQHHDRTTTNNSSGDNDNDNRDNKQNQSSSSSSSCNSRIQRDQNNNVVQTSIIPQTGTLVLFDHDLYHAGAPLLWGRKYVLRTDILFENTNDDDGGSTSALDRNSTSTTTTETTSTANITNVHDPKEETTLLLVDSNDDSSSYLVIQLCQELNWSNEYQSILHDMDLLQVTLESFLVPGRIILRTLLLDCGRGIISETEIDTFLQLAQERIES